MNFLKVKLCETNVHFRIESKLFFPLNLFSNEISKTIFNSDNRVV